MEIVEEVVGIRELARREDWGVPPYKVKTEDSEENTIEVNEPQMGAIPENGTGHGAPIKSENGSPVPTLPSIPVRVKEEQGSSPATDLPVKEEEKSSSSEDEIDPPLQVLQTPVTQREVEVIDVNSDSEEENLNANSSSRRRRYKFRRHPSDSTRNSTLQNQEDNISSSDEEEPGITLRSGKRLKVVIEAKRISDDKSLKDIMKKLQRESDSSAIEEYRKLIIESTVTNTAMIPFCRKYGPEVDEIEIISWIWTSDNQSNPSVNSDDNVDLAMLLTHCKNLASLTLGPSPSASKLKRLDDLNLTLRNLRFLSFDARSSGALAAEGQSRLGKMLASIFKAAENLETFQSKMTTREDLVVVLNAMKSSATLPALQNLETLNLASNEDMPVLLKEEDVKCIGDMKLKLKSLILGFGLWSDITNKTFLAMLSSSLEELNIQGTFQGKTNEKTSKQTISLDFPPLSKLTKLSIGGKYSFSSPMQNSSGRDTTVRKKQDEIGLLKVHFKLPMLKNLESIRLGSLCYIDHLSPNYFPKLKSLRIGGPWNLSFDFLNEDITFPTVTELQFPDGLKDTSFSSRIPSFFPNLKKAWIFLPSGKVLQSFIRAVEREGGPAIEELHLKTQFDFESTFTSCLLKRKPGVEVEVPSHEKLIIKAINRYQHRDEFVAHYNIEMPEEETDPEDRHGYAGVRDTLVYLKLLTLEHVPRVIRIPEGELKWDDANCKFSGRVIGYQKFPLTGKCVNELPLRQLQTCEWPNFALDLAATRYLAEHGFTGSGVVDVTELGGGGDYDSSGLDDDDDDGPSFGPSSSRPKARSGPPKVRIEPSAVRFAPFESKSERN